MVQNVKIKNCENEKNNLEKMRNKQNLDRNDRMDENLLNEKKAKKCKIQKCSEEAEEEYLGLKRVANLMRKCRGNKNSRECFEAIGLHQFSSLDELLNDRNTIEILEEWFEEQIAGRNVNK